MYVGDAGWREEGLLDGPLHIAHPHPALLPPEENPAWLPLYGSVCCRLVAQPLCMTQPTASGTLRVQVRGPEEWKGSGSILREPGHLGIKELLRKEEGRAW